MAAEAHGASANANAGAVAGAGDVGASLRRPFSGQLSKFTNVMKGWQYRWFVLDPEQGRIMYYLPKSGEAAADRSSSGAPASASGPGPGKHRGSQHLAGTVVLPSDEDSQTFHLNFASGESFKLRAANVKERQVWVDRIRAVVQMHDAALAHLNPPPLGHAAASLLRGADHHGARPPTPPGSRSHISNGEPSQQLQHLSLSVLDAFGSVHDIIHQVITLHFLAFIISIKLENHEFPHFSDEPEERGSVPRGGVASFSGPGVKVQPQARFVSALS